MNLRNLAGERVSVESSHRCFKLTAIKHGCIIYMNKPVQGLVESQKINTTETEWIKPQSCFLAATTKITEKCQRQI